MVAAVGQGSATLTLAPDPPSVGNETATVSVSGVDQSKLVRTKVSFYSDMPAMSMSGPNGQAAPVAGHPGQWTFAFPTAYATAWTLKVRFSGGFNALARFAFAVAAGSSPSQTGSMGSMSGGHEAAWRVAALLLALFTVIAGLAALNASRAAARAGRPISWLTPANVFLVAAGIVVILGMAVLQSRFAPPSMDMQSMQTVAGSAPVPVTEAKATLLGLGPKITAPGAIQAYLTQDIVARVSGILRDFTAYNGTHVVAGQALALLEEPELGAQAAAASAGARSDQAAAQAAMIEAHHHAPDKYAIAQEDAAAKEERAKYWRHEIERERVLFINGAVSAQEYQDEQAQAASAYADAASAQRQMQDARADIEMAQDNAESALAKASSSGAAAQAASVMAGYTQIIAPDDAVVVKRLVDPGSYVQAGTPVLRIQVVNKVRIQAIVAQDDLQNVRLGAPFEATLPDGQTVHAFVTSVQPAADPATHTALVEAIVDNADGTLVPGTYVRVVISGVAERVRHDISVPSTAVVGAGPDTSVWTDVNGSAHRVPVRVLSDDGAHAEVVGALKAGDRVVTEGAQNLEESTAITERTR
jgi:multidrug efflux pump subunit AcrA (membrane-fusion protein)